MTVVIGITGGIGSGKSTVCGLLSEEGALVLDADAASREVVEEPEVRAALVRRFGEAIFDGDGRLDRAALADLVFGPDASDARRDLEAIIHPAVRARIDGDLARARDEGRPLVVLDVPLLMRSPYREECDLLVFVRSARETRNRRTARRGWTPDELERRERAQTPLAEKERAADRVLDNDGDLAELRAAVRELVRGLPRN
ncbi:MAG: dephospho-CoA kinase [Planctomycetota bacterium]